ncbi:chorismate synthase [Putridiphycobacter roseus]|uniref:Chorismate synthase n=1 Tax=Putridiphycobacter roseus TaxID=2219161 RepID=A0A2W1MYN1_9FLAO|nr:chorismate synthase [Putridiphycobacter roseus]PZE15661.1 chorismate synthase [Putridiphycobacter roseus]
MNTFGRQFKVSIFGESHGESVGITIDGCPPGVPLLTEDLMTDILRRKSGAKGTTPRIESDLPQIISGVFNHKTTGAPITILFANNNIKSKDYSNLLKHPRPGHSDFVAMKKYKGFNDYRGGGYFSGRLTLALVAAGSIAKKIVPHITISAKLKEVGGSKNIDEAVQKALESKNSIGGIVECSATGIPIGLGEPFFGSIHAKLSQIVFSIPAMKGIEFGAGFFATKMTGEEHNDNIIDETGKTETNNAGGISGGISNGNDLLFRVAVKPTSSISTPQETYNFESGTIETLLIEGRHDTCIALRVPPVIEAVTAIVLADLSRIMIDAKL